MVFSSIEFLYMFLPLVLISYFLVPKRFKNMILLIFSLFFYFYGEPRYIIILILSFVFNYYFGKLIENSNDKKKRKTLLIVDLLVNFGLLFYFKYFNFFLDNINAIFSTNMNVGKIVMPIGISFFTFQATSYVIDIYRKKVKSAKNLTTFAAYLALFPQLIAGPIVRYETIEDELKNRKHSFKLFSDGTKRFIVGLSKKVLLANVLGELSKNLIQTDAPTVFGNWIIAISDTLQIYFDFSGYSDMAIGLGLMFGFKFLENFNYPLIAKSITDFWRRWHMSLSSWFKDYVYIPLGGSKKGEGRRYLNIFIVWMCTGLWHGASWNFILWGLYFALLLIIEKKFLMGFLDKHKIIAHMYTFFLIIISFIIFNNTHLKDIGTFIEGMFGFGGLKLYDVNTIYYLRNYVVILLIALIASTPLIKKIKEKLLERSTFKNVYTFIEPILYIILLIISTAFIVDESFSPFLYFRF